MGIVVGFVSPLREAGQAHLVTGAELAASWGAHLTALLFNSLYFETGRRGIHGLWNYPIVKSSFQKRRHTRVKILLADWLELL